MANLLHDRDEDNPVNPAGDMHLPRNNGMNHSVPCTCPSSSCPLHRDKTPATSSYLKTFMFDSSSDEEIRTHTTANQKFQTTYQSSYQSSNHQSSALPKYPAKRRRVTSSGSHSDNDVFKPKSGQMAYDTSSARTSRNSSEKSTKSGPVCGMFGVKSDSRPCHRPKFPSDDSEDTKKLYKSSTSLSPGEFVSQK